MKKIFLIYGIFISLSVFLLSGCGANIFSLLNPTSIDTQTDANVLIGMGQDYMNKLDYTNAYRAYARAVTLAPKNSRALEGAAIAYIYMHFDFSALYTAIMSANYASLGPNNIYNVGRVVSQNLGKIVMGQADGVIPANDVNDNLDFYIFNNFYSIFNMIDSDSDNDINWDTNDYLIMSNNMSITNRVDTVIADVATTMDLVPVVAMAYNINYVKKISFTNAQQWCNNSIALVNAAMISDSTKAVVTMISNTFTGNVSNLNDAFDAFDTMDLAAIFGGGNYEPLTNYFTNDYDVLTNQLYNQGIWPPSQVTNAMPDMTNVYPVLTNYYGRITLD